MTFTPPTAVASWRAGLVAIAEHLPDTSVSVSDAAGRWVVVEGAWLRRRGLQAADVVGLPITTFVAPATAAGLEEIAAVALAGGACSRSFPAVEPDGRPATWRVTVSPLAVDGEPMVLWTGRDVDPELRVLRARADELQAAGSRLRATLEHAPSGMAVLDVVGSRLQVTAVNGRLAELMGTPVDTYLGVDVAASLAAGSGGPEILELLRAGVAESRPQRRRSWVLHGSGRHVPVEVSCSAPLHSPTADGEDRTQLVIAFEDLTRQQETRRALAEALVSEQAAADRLRDLDRVRTDFLAAVSHELRTPLANILGRLEVLLDGDLGPVPHDQHQLLEVVDTQARRLRELIERLLLTNTVSSGTEAPAPTHAVDLAAVVHRVTSEQREALRARDRHLAVSIDAPDDGLVVRGSVERLAHAVSELISNAAHASPAAGVITVRCAADGTRGAVVEVADEGPGIAAADRARVFDRFFRTEHATRAAWPGTGLGLWLVAETARTHGGRVTIEQARIGGALLRLQLPLAVDPA